jgi:hypothetical protein
MLCLFIPLSEYLKLMTTYEGNDKVDVDGTRAKKGLVLAPRGKLLPVRDPLR